MDWLESVAAILTPEVYQRVAMVQIMLWTAADVVIVYALLSIGNVFRMHRGVRCHRWPFVVLIVTVLLASTLPFARASSTIFWIEALVIGPHYLLILYCLVADGTLVYDVLRSRQGSAGNRADAR